MHSYTVASQLQDVIQRDNVIMVDSGHTHYNDVANDGHTVYAAGRNTGQVTEGPVGFDMINLDNGGVSWKFKPLGSWPFAMITSPSDEQLMIDGTQVVHGATDIRAKIWDDKGVASATMTIDNGTPIPMQQIGTTQMWSVPWDSTAAGDGEHHLTLNVKGAGGNTTEDQITVLVNQSGTAQLPQRTFGPTGNSLGAYAEKGLLGNHTAAAGGKGAPGGAACPPTANAATGAATATPGTPAANTGTAPSALAASGSPAAGSQMAKVSLQPIAPRRGPVAKALRVAPVGHSPAIPARLRARAPRRERRVRRFRPPATAHSPLPVMAQPTNPAQCPPRIPVRAANPATAARDVARRECPPVPALSQARAPNRALLPCPLRPMRVTRRRTVARSPVRSPPPAAKAPPARRDTARQPSPQSTVIR